MRLSEVSIRRPVTIVMIIAIVLLLGFISLTNLNIDLFPDMNLPIAVVVTQYSGTGPEEIETLVTRPLEEIMGTVQNIESIQSFSQTGSSIVVVQFDWGTDIDSASQDMREKVDMIRAALPDDCEDPMIFEMDPNMMPVMTLAMSGSVGLDDIKLLAEDEVKNRLERIEGVASVEISGGLNRQILVEIRPEALESYGISLQQVINSLRGENLNVSGGTVEEGGREYLVRVVGQFPTVESIGNVHISSPTGGSLRLGDIAVIEDGFRDIDQYSTVNGKHSVALFVSKQSGANTVEVARKINDTLEELRGRLPQTVEIFPVVDQSEFIEKSINSVLQNIILGSILAILVLFVFLRSVRTTLIIGVAIPISVIATFALVYFRGLTLNMMTLGGLALGVGMMVDNSIVILENIFRHRHEGADRAKAAYVGASEVAMAITASTLTTVAVFFPIVFVKGLASEIFTPLALTVSFALLASLGVALTLVPMMASQLLVTEVNGTGDNEDTLRGRIFAKTGAWLDGLDEKYRRLLQWSLGRKKTVLLITVGTLVLSIALLPLVGVEFIPTVDEGLMSVSVELPHGSTLERTEEVITRVTEIVEAQPETDTIMTTVGSQLGQSSGFMSGEGQSEYGRLDVLLVDKNERKRSTMEVVEAVREEVNKIPGAEFGVAASDPLMPGGGGDDGGAPMSIEIRGNDLDTLARIAEDIHELVASVPGTREVYTSLEGGSPEAEIRIDRSKAALYGINPAEIGTVTRAAVDGQIVTRFRTGDDEVDVRVRFPEEYREKMQDLMDLKLSGSGGIQVPLSEVGELVLTEGPNVIQRNDQVRTVTVSSQLFGRSLGHVEKEIREKLDRYVLPSGYTVEYGGESKEMAEAFGDLSIALLLALVLVYMILAAQFESFMSPLVIMFSLPVTIVGVVLGLLFTGRSFSVVAFVGAIMLAGIVVNNAIVLVDYINQLRARGMDREEAILEAGPTRLRPILMTALTTILGMVPLAIGIGEGAEVRTPMGTAVIGGLLTSTVLTLVVVPVMYIILDNLGTWIRAKLRFINGDSTDVSA